MVSLPNGTGIPTYLEKLSLARHLKVDLPVTVHGVTEVPKEGLP